MHQGMGGKEARARGFQLHALRPFLTPPSWSAAPSQPLPALGSIFESLDASSSDNGAWRLHPTNSHLQCLIPAPTECRTLLPWPTSHKVAQFVSMSTVERAAQDWIQVGDDRFRFPGGGMLDSAPNRSHRLIAPGSNQPGPCSQLQLRIQATDTCLLPTSGFFPAPSCLPVSSSSKADTGPNSILEELFLAPSSLIHACTKAFTAGRRGGRGSYLPVPAVRASNSKLPAFLQIVLAGLCS